MCRKSNHRPCTRKGDASGGKASHSETSISQRFIPWLVASRPANPDMSRVEQRTVNSSLRSGTWCHTDKGADGVPGTNHCGMLQSCSDIFILREHLLFFARLLAVRGWISVAVSHAKGGVVPVQDDADDLVPVQPVQQLRHRFFLRFIISNHNNNPVDILGYGDGLRGKQRGGGNQ
ncbi:hypothetical protein SAMN05216233_102258 [Desulfoluna spongiiphila]|uniref:Uncharacterized protein n=1 Tax=Desulfoluna spongiiphila TaxID=419481 RepID=A0A1G5BY85_9BACT|nr:hypothetical protein SAMN05216233_102258 [Desulfoluna spongiiphila]